jgi:hypothetical protein
MAEDARDGCVFAPGTEPIAEGYGYPPDRVEQRAGPRVLADLAARGLGAARLRGDRPLAEDGRRRCPWPSDRPAGVSAS